MLLIYCLNQTFVVTVLTTIFVSDFPLLTKVLTDFVHPPTLLTFYGTQLKNPRSPYYYLPFDNSRQNNTRPTLSDVLVYQTRFEVVTLFRVERQDHLSQ